MRSTSICLALPLALVATSVAVFVAAGPAAAATCTRGAPSDFNGDGIPDAAISEGIPNISGGNVHVLYGTRAGLTAGPSGTALDDQRLVTMPMYSSRFGAALAVGDINGDGCGDLVVGDPIAGLNDEVESAGAIYVYYGSPTGLGSANEISLNSILPGYPAGDDNDFGAALAIGDFNDDGLADIVVGAPGRDGGGEVYLLPGVRNPFLPVLNARQFEQGDGTIPGTNEIGDRIGSAFAVGDFDGDGVDDLAIGDPGENHGAGAVFVLRGSATASLLTATGRQTWTQGSDGVPGGAEPGDGFGSALAVGDFAGNGRTDLAIGVPYESFDGITQAGYVNVLYSTGSAGLTGTGSQGWSRNSTGLTGPGASYARFGTTLAAGDFDGRGHDSLAIGAPLKTVNGAKYAGSVTVIPGSSTGGLTASGSTFWTQASPGVIGTPQEMDSFGVGLAALPITSATRDDLLIGAYDDTVGGNSGAGSLEFLPSSPTGPTTTGSTDWSVGTAGVKGILCGCNFGSVIG